MFFAQVDAHNIQLAFKTTFGSRADGYGNADEITPVLEPFRNELLKMVHKPRTVKVTFV